MTIKNNRFYKKFKSLTTTSDIEEEKKKRIKALGKQEDKSTTAKELSQITKGVIGDEEYEYFMKLIGGKTKD